jgi:predicted dehydrogenase
MTEPEATQTSLRTRPPVNRAKSGPVGVGVIGAGMISDTYLEHLTSFPDIRVVIVGDLDEPRAQSQADKYGVPESGGADEVLHHPEVELIVNLTIPAAHAAVASAAVAAGKHVWSEKPISIARSSARALLDGAQQAGRLVGVAPDTVLGPGLQTARRAIARGDIGTPVSAQTTIQYPGPDLFHPNPEFLFAEGAGPLYDVGPYFITALVHVFGPFAHVAAVGSTAHQTRTVRVGERAGTPFSVAIPTHVAAIAQFVSGGVAQSIFSFESPLARFGIVEITGTEGTMVVPDPNRFNGDIKITQASTFDKLHDEPEWRTIPASGVVAGRGIGALDMARCIRNGGSPLASGELAYHVLDTMIAIDESIQLGQTVVVASTVEPPRLVDEAWDPYQATL